jgi:hypothetical protein
MKVFITPIVAAFLFAAVSWATSIYLAPRVASAIASSQWMDDTCVTGQSIYRIQFTFSGRCLS